LGPEFGRHAITRVETSLDAAGKSARATQSVSTFRGGPHHARDGVGHLFPFRLFGGKLPLAGWRETVILELALLVLGGGLPFRRHPAFSLQAMQSWIERPMLHLQHVVGSPLQMLGDLVAMGGTE